jgi:hypothetical protein
MLDNRSVGDTNWKDKEFKKDLQELLKRFRYDKGPTVKRDRPGGSAGCWLSSAEMG